MSIASAIQNAQQKVANAYTAISNKGGTLPATQNLSNMPTAITSIPSGATPTGTINITTNGTVDVTNYASANVNVKKYGCSIDNILGGVDSNGVYQAPSSVVNQAHLVFTGVKKMGTSLISGRTMQYLFYNNPSIRSVSFPDLEEVVIASAFSSMCYSCSKNESVSMPNLKTISAQNAFDNAFYANRLHSIDFSSLETVSGNYVFNLAFQGVFFGTNYLQTVTFPALSNISGASCFQNAFTLQTALTSLSFPALTSTSFGSNTNQFNSMLASITGCTVHFPSNLQSVIGNWSDVTNGFGGTNTTVLFDLEPTE